MLRRLLTPGRTLVPIAAAAVLLAVAGCGGADGTGGGAAGGDRTITFATPGGANVSNTPFLVAQGTGAFDRHGLTVEPQEFATGVDALAALTGGSVDVAMIAGLDLLRAAEKDAGVLGFYTPFLSSASAIVASTRLQADHGTDLGRFADASWGYAKEGTSSTFYLQTLATAPGSTGTA
ncbi:hypothetical protein BJF78_00500 [Pseudonocardia sp. CNS-139]|nr:hypothetical protein BJF78_00500 [Pseudonocardia sp. CNS-139]